MRNTWILVLTYKYPEGLKKCLDSILITTKENIKTKVILNGVNKQDYAFVHKRNDIEEIINIEENIGFFKAYNKAILTIPPEDYFVILNDDVVITDERWLTAMYDSMTNLSIPKNQDPKTFNTKIGIVGYRQIARVPVGETGNAEDQKTDRWILSCALVNPKAIRLCGLFDERYNHWWGDFEFLCRMHNFGYKLSTVDEEYIFHEKQHTYELTDSFNEKNTWPIWDAMCFYEQCGNKYFEWKEAMPFPIQQILIEVKWFLRGRLNKMKK